MSSTDILLRSFYRITVPMTGKGIDCRQVDSRLKCLDIDRNGRIAEKEVWEYTAQNKFGVQNLISRLYDCGKNTDLKVELIAVLAKIGRMGMQGSRMANDAIIKYSQSACADKLQLACIDAISKMDYEPARINLQRIRDQFGPFKLDIAPLTRRQASLVLLELDTARFRKAARAGNKAEAESVCDNLALLRHSVGGVSNAYDIKDGRQLCNEDIALIKTALFLLGRISKAQKDSKDRGCVIHAFAVLQNDYPGYPFAGPKKLDCLTLRMLEAELKRLY